jgi:hypothetical protein
MAKTGKGKTAATGELVGNMSVATTGALDNVAIQDVSTLGLQSDLPGDRALLDGAGTIDDPLVESPSKKRRSESDYQSDNPSGASVVTPSKPLKQFYLMNTVNGAVEKFSSPEGANNFKDALVTFVNIEASSIVIEQFDSESDARSFLKTKYNVPDRSTDPVELVDAKMPALPNTQVNLDARDVLYRKDGDSGLLDDDDVPYRPVIADTARSTAGLSHQTPQMSAFAAATIGLGTSIVVMRWRLPGCRYHVYAFKLMDGKELYWSHKPQMWMYAVQTEKDAPIFLPEDNMTLHRALNRCSAAGIRASPGGANTILTIKTQRTNKVIDQYLLYGLVHVNKTNDEISDLIRNFVRHCDKPMVREAYHLTIREKMQSPAISDDTKATGKYWIKLASGARNILFEEKPRLNDVFLDQDIETIIHLAYNIPPGSVQSLPTHVRTAAFGRTDPTG